MIPATVGILMLVILGLAAENVRLYLRCRRLELRLQRMVVCRGQIFIPEADDEHE